MNHCSHQLRCAQRPDSYQARAPKLHTQPQAACRSRLWQIKKICKPNCSFKPRQEPAPPFSPTLNTSWPLSTDCSTMHVLPWA